MLVAQVARCLGLARSKPDDGDWLRRLKAQLYAGGGVARVGEGSLVGQAQLATLRCLA